jgi:hypothetical protein
MIVTVEESCIKVKERGKWRDAYRYETLLDADPSSSNSSVVTLCSSDVSQYWLSEAHTVSVLSYPISS